MMPVEIPIADFASFTEEVTLESVPYRLEFTWNDRNEFWALTIKNRDLVTLIAGIKIVLSYPLLVIHPDRGLPPGELIAIDTTGDAVTVNRTNLGDNVRLIYYTEDEFDAI